MTRDDRSALLRRHGPGLLLIVGAYLPGDDRAEHPGRLRARDLARAGRRPWSPRRSPGPEILVALVVLVANGLSVLIVDNRRAFFAALGVAIAGGLLMLGALAALAGSRIDGFTFMVLLGSGLYLPYVAVHTTVFERLIAMTRERGNLGFLMYVADSAGYLGYAALMIARSALPVRGRLLAVLRGDLRGDRDAHGREPGTRLGLLRPPTLEARRDRGGALTRTTPAAVFHGPGQAIEIREIPLPEPARPGGPRRGDRLHALRERPAQPAAADGPCRCRRSSATRSSAGSPSSGRTAPRVDAAGRPLGVGDRVTWAIVASCGDCFYCRRDLPQKCERQTKYGHEPIRPGGELTGGLAGHCVLAPGTAIFRVPEGLSDASACPANCAGATVAAAIEAAGPLEDARVLVMGSGMLGVTATAWARSLGAEQRHRLPTSPPPGSRWPRPSARRTRQPRTRSPGSSARPPRATALTSPSS